MISKAAGSFGKMSFADKLIMTKVGTDVAGALFGPTPAEEAEALAIEEAKFRGSFYGMDAGGNTISQSITDVKKAGTPQDNELFNSAISGGQPSQAATNTITPEQQQLIDGRGRKELFPSGSRPQIGMTAGPGPMQSQINVPSNINSPGENVRYVDNPQPA